MERADHKMAREFQPKPRVVSKKKKKQKLHKREKKKNQKLIEKEEPAQMTCLKVQRRSGQLQVPE